MKGTLHRPAPGADMALALEPHWAVVRRRHGELKPRVAGWFRDRILALDPQSKPLEDFRASGRRRGGEGSAESKEGTAGNLLEGAGANVLEGVKRY